MSIFYIDCLRLFEGKEETSIRRFIFYQSLSCELKYIYIRVIII